MNDVAMIAYHKNSNSMAMHNVAIKSAQQRPAEIENQIEIRTPIP